MQRNTWQRDAVREALEDVDGFVSAQGLHANLLESGSRIGLATVYRTLTRLQSQDGENLYRACSTGHHHHLICRSCGLTVEIGADAVEIWAQKVATENGFTDPAHVVDVFGLCPTCTAAAASTAHP